VDAGGGRPPCRAATWGRLFGGPELIISNLSYTQ